MAIFGRLSDLKKQFDNINELDLVFNYLRQTITYNTEINARICSINRDQYKKVENKTAELVAAATIELLQPYKDLVLTITADNGKEFALTIKRHWNGILNSFDSHLTNGSMEGINSMIQAAKARARGYSMKHNLALMAYLIAGKLAHLPRSPFEQTTTSCGQEVAA